MAPAYEDEDTDTETELQHDNHAGKVEGAICFLFQKGRVALALPGFADDACICFSLVDVGVGALDIGAWCPGYFALLLLFFFLNFRFQLLVAGCGCGCGSFSFSFSFSWRCSCSCSWQLGAGVDCEF